MLATHDAADVMNHRVVGDNGHGGVECVGLSVKRQNLFAVLGLARHQWAGQLRPVINMQGTPQINRDEVGDIDERRNRLLANCLQLARHPFGRCLIGNARHALRIKCRAAFDVVSANVGRGIGSVKRRKRGDPVNLGQRLERAKPCRC